MTDTPPLPQSRYGRAPMPASTRRRVAITLGVLATLALIGAAVAAYQRFEGVDVEGKMVAYEVLDDQTVAVTISVTRKDPATPVVCIVRARSEDGAETGRREVLVGPADARTIQVTASVKSFKRPLVGDIYGCGTDVPAYLRSTG
ncbi:MAG: DUF4307 domain-containing protein [Mycobacteriaceae bacterium]